MIRKLRKWIKDIQKFKYFSYFGQFFRDEESVDSDFENNNDKANKTKDKIKNRKKKGLTQNNNGKNKNNKINIDSSDSFDGGIKIFCFVPHIYSDSHTSTELKIIKPQEDKNLISLGNAILTYANIKKLSKEIKLGNQLIQKKGSYYLDHSMGSFVDVDLSRDERRIDELKSSKQNE